MKTIYIRIIICFITTFGIAQAQIAEKNGYIFSNKDLSNLFNLTEVLSGVTLTNNEEREIYNWSIAKFKADPRQASKSYKSLGEMYGRINNSQSQFEWDIRIYRTYHRLHYQWYFKNYGGDRNFFSIVKQLNPIYFMNNKKKLFTQEVDYYVAEKNGFYLTRFMLNSMVEVAEFIAQAKFRDTHKDYLREWAIKEFKERPAINTSIYADLINVILPKIYIEKRPQYELENTREHLYDWMYYHFPLKPKGLNYNLVDIITYYNPVIMEDGANKAVLSESTLHLGLSKYKFLQEIIGIPVTITDNVLLYEKEIYFNDFVKRGENGKNKNIYHSGISDLLIKSKIYWNNLNKQQKSSLAKEMKNIFLNSRDAKRAGDHALQPLYTRVINSYIISRFINISFSSQGIFQSFFTNLGARQAEIFKDISDGFSETSTLLSLQLSDAKNIKDRGNYYTVEYSGIKYNVNK